MLIPHARRASLISLLFAGAAAAQDLQNFRPTPSIGGYFTVETVRTTPHRLITPSIWIHDGMEPVVRRDREAAISQVVVSHQLTLDLQGAIGLAGRYEFTAGLPVSYVAGEGLAEAGHEGVGLGDVRLGAKIRLAGMQDEQPAGVALVLPFTLPTGDTDRFLGSQGFTATPTVVGEVRGHGLALAAQTGARLRTETDRVENIEISHELVYGVAGSVELDEDSLKLLAELAGSAALTEVLDEDVARPLETFLGLRLDTRFGGLFTVGGGIGINPDRGVPRFRGMVGFAWRPPPKRGPQIDAAALLGDSDQDGVLDLDDRCPSSPEDEDGFEDDDGCPDVDNDQDGIRDSLDRCPDEPETVNGFQDADGCPDAGDNDKDGIPNDVDGCPDEAEDRDGFEDTDGCIDLDNDADGVPDTRDRCPDQSETFNGFADQDGCPDEVPEEAPPPPRRKR
ncbi:MAG: thrombospondin type 3 repeat-containing protein [bacterium]